MFVLGLSSHHVSCPSFFASGFPKHLDLVASPKVCLCCLTGMLHHFCSSSLDDVEVPFRVQFHSSRGSSKVSFEWSQKTACAPPCMSVFAALPSVGRRISEHPTSVANFPTPTLLPFPPRPHTSTHTHTRSACICQKDEMQSCDVGVVRCLKATVQWNWSVAWGSVA